MMNEVDGPHEKLLREWAELEHHRGEVFISDGIIDPDRWARAPVKVLFLLREAYGYDESWDLRAALRNEEWGHSLGQTYSKAAQWAYAVHKARATSAPQIPESADEREDARQSFLASAIVNIKKSSGKSSTETDDIEFYVGRDGALIRKQVEIIAPDVVICGNVWSTHNLDKWLWPSAEYQYDMVWRDRDSSRFFIDFWHPGNQFPSQMNYYALIALLQNGGVFGGNRRTITRTQ